MSGFRFTGAAAKLTPPERAKVAAFRFGLGPKKGLIAELSSSPEAAFDACWKELTSETAATDVRIPPPKVNGRQLTADEDLARYRAGASSHLIAPDLSWEELSRRYAKHLDPKIGFVERLALFWANHFSIHVGKSVAVTALVGHFERTVIRQHVLGNYADMLAAALTHPAMIRYLDNTANKASSPLENLARETLELYTLGSAKRYPRRTTGYVQDDVEAMTRLLTGWTVVSKSGSHPDNGLFLFNPSDHDERAQTLMGQTFGASGQQKGLDALRWLALHEHTAEHIATKLLRHFAFDDPEPEHVETLKKSYLDNNGNLLEVSKALLKMEEVWDATVRVRPPHLWMVSMARALDFTAADFAAPPANYVHWEWQMVLNLLGHAQWYRVTPDGYPDRDADWIHPDAMRMRTNIAAHVLFLAFRRGHTSYGDPEMLRTNLLPGSVRVTLPSGVGDTTRSKIADIFLTTDFITR